VNAETEQPLRVRLDAPLPAEVAVGEGTALFVCGSCFAGEQRIRALSILVDGQQQPVTKHGMPRLDLFRSLHPGLDPFALGDLRRDPTSEEDPGLHSYRSGFWGMATIGPATGPRCELALRASLDDGGVLTTPLAEIDIHELARADPIDPPASGEPLIAVCMATFEPPLELFRRQVESIRAQTHESWVCVVSDDCSSPAHFAAIEAELAGDPRFILSRSPRRLGFYLNFERALSLAPANAAYVALADQDDRWYPEKLATLTAEIGSAQLVYSDARVIDCEGNVRSDSYWVRRRNNHSDLLSLLVANSVTGAASLFRADLLEHVLPFPPGQFAHFHDHWIGLVALALGDLAFVPRPLYDYVQHGSAALGHAAANRMIDRRARLASLRKDNRERVRMWRLHYFVDVSRLQQLATVLRLRVGERMSPGKARALRGFVRAEDSWPALAGLWRRGARELVGRPETLGAEWMLAYAFTWRRLLALSARDHPVRGLRLDAVPPPDLVMAPGREVAAHPLVREIADKVAPLSLAVSDHAPPRINLLIPTIDLGHFFGGYIGKFNLARRLAESGQRVRIVTVDPVGPLPADWRSQIEGYDGLADMFERVEIAFGREAHGLEVSRTDRFVATTWWTAHIAHAALRELGRERFLYLIQEYEPFTFPMGTYAALADESYTFAHTALFSTELLRGYFRRHELGVFALSQGGDSASAAFQNAITAVRAPTAAELSARTSRRLLFYARPESHASRNMFELGVLALTEAVRGGALRGWELNGIGSVGAGRFVPLGSGAELELAPRSGQAAYADLLREHDLGLALMYTPHPSLVPIEMASAGMVTVTNRFENKTPAALAQISANLLAPEPTVPAIAAALAAAVAASEDHAGRVRGAQVNWSQSWDESFSDALVQRIIELLGGCVSASSSRLGATEPAPSPAVAPPPGSPRFALFDSLRGIAVLCIITYHVTSITGDINRPVIGDLFAVVGNQALLFFFVISGFLLYRPYAAAHASDRRRPNTARYARRRAFRILPAYWTALTLLAIFPGIVGVFSGDWWRYYGFLQAYSDRTINGGIPPAWSLCVEVSFYALLPVWALLIRVVHRRIPFASWRRSWQRSEFAGLALLALLGVSIQLAASRLLISSLLATTLLGECTWLALGMALAVASVTAAQAESESRLVTSVTNHPGICWVGALACLIGATAVLQPGGLFNIIVSLRTPQPVARTLGGILLTGGLGALLVAPAVFGDQAGGLPRRILRFRPLAWLGTVSYSVYLYHLAVAELLWESADPAHFSASGLGLAARVHSLTTPILFVLTVAGSASAAAISYYVVELPFLRRKER
jgi:peptidoglycan/LPS O-acetylase OafA/YrhL/glycosyltransferase involved in cell wall biosynthesis